MKQFEKGDSVRIDIPDKDDPDFKHHRKTGEVIDVVEDDVGSVSGDPRDSVLYFISLDDSDIHICFRWRDLRPADSE